MSMEYLKTKPITVIGGGAVGKTIAVDCKLGVGDSQEVRLFDAMPFAAQTLKNLEKTGLNLVGPQTNRDGFYRGGKAYLDMVTSDMAKAVKGAGIIVVAMGAYGHEPTFKNLAPLLEDGQGPDDGGELHAVVGGLGLAAADLLLVLPVQQHRPPAPGTGVAGAGAVGVDGYSLH